MKITIYNLVMPFELKLAWLYFRSARKGLVRFTSIAAVAGVALGVASLIVAQALANGFSNEMRDKVLGNTPHILVTQKGTTKISNWRIIKQKLHNLGGVVKVLPSHYENAVISTQSGESKYAVLRVKAPAGEINGPNLKLEKEQVSVSVGKRLAEKLQLKEGNEINLLTLANEKLPNSSSAIVEDIFETGLHDYDSTWIFIAESDYLRLKSIDQFSPTVFGVDVEDVFATEKIAGSIQKILGEGFEVIDWREANKPLFAALTLERKVSFAIILLIILVAVLNVTTTLSLLINERKIDIAILRSCGANLKSLMSVFLFEGMILSAIGVFTGVLTGVLVCMAGNYFRLVSISREVYSLSYIPFDISPGNVLLIIIAALVLCLGSILYPVLSVSRVKPFETIRNA